MLLPLPNAQDELGYLSHALWPLYAVHPDFLIPFRAPEGPDMINIGNTVGTNIAGIIPSYSHESLTRP